MHCPDNAILRPHGFFAMTMAFGLFAIILFNIPRATAQIDTNNNDIANSINNEATTKETTSDKRWKATTALMSEMNRLWAGVAANASQLYIPADQPTVATMLQTPECIVNSFTHHRLNHTATHEFFCCHRRRFAPLRRIIHLGNQQLIEGTTDGTDDTPEKTLYNIERMMTVDMHGAVWGACKDQLKFHTPEWDTASSLGYDLVAGAVISMYQFVEINLSSLLSCVYDAPLPPHCISSTPLALANMSVPQLLYESNPHAASFCSAPKLAAFDTFLATAQCNGASLTQARAGAAAL